MTPQDWISHGAEFPYVEGFAAGDQAEAAALGILANLCDRRGIKHELQAVDEDIRREIVTTMAEIIRAAALNNGESKTP